MGFCFKGCNTIFPAEVKNDVLIVHIHENVTCEMPCPLGKDIPIQQNIFYGRAVAFYFEDEDFKYVGRMNQIFSKYRKDTNELVGRRYWGSMPVSFITGMQATGIFYENIMAVEGLKTIVLPAVTPSIILLKQPLDLVRQKDLMPDYEVEKKVIVTTKEGLNDITSDVSWVTISQGPRTAYLG